MPICDDEYSSMAESRRFFYVSLSILNMLPWAQTGVLLDCCSGILLDCCGILILAGLRSGLLDCWIFGLLRDIVGLLDYWIIGGGSRSGFAVTLNEKNKLGFSSPWPGVWSSKSSKIIVLSQKNQ